MNYETWNSDEDESDENYFDFLNWLKKLTISEMRQLKGNEEEQKIACCRYFKRGYRANLSAGELIDFLGVSSPSILDEAEYSEKEIVALFQISDILTQDEINQVEI